MASPDLLSVADPPRRRPVASPPRRGRKRPAAASSHATTRSLVHSSDTEPGIRRVRAGRGFSYRAADGTPVKDAATLQRIRSLAVPPAYRDVWICADPRGHLQATGRDARGRKQHRYHPAWRALRDETKYGRLAAFGEALARIRRRTGRDLAAPDLTRRKLLATVVRLLETSMVRIGNEEYAAANRSFGLTTLRKRHADVAGARILLSFRGKSGKEHRVALSDRRLARVVRACRELPGQRLFQYFDEHHVAHAIGSEDVNAYIREIAGAEFSAKDFRTWAGTCLAAAYLGEAGPPESERMARSTIVACMRHVAERLGNTAAVTRKCYVHPAVLEAYQAGSLDERPVGPAQVMALLGA
ncbi:MAG: DNA topoisomerase IB [Alphaproteobacteria bacterium]